MLLKLRLDTFIRLKKKIDSSGGHGHGLILMKIYIEIFWLQILVMMCVELVG